MFGFEGDKCEKVSLKRISLLNALGWSAKAGESFESYSNFVRIVKYQLSSFSTVISEDRVVCGLGLNLSHDQNSAV